MRCIKLIIIPNVDSCSEDDEESEEEQDDHDDHDEQDEPEEGQAEAVKVKHRQMVAGTPPPPANRYVRNEIYIKFLSKNCLRKFSTTQI